MRKGSAAKERVKPGDSRTKGSTKKALIFLVNIVRSWYLLGIIFAIILAVVVFIWRTLATPTIVITGITSNAKQIEKGYTPEALTNQFLNEVMQIGRGSYTSDGRFRLLATSQSYSEPKIQIPSTDINLYELAIFVGRFFSVAPPRVSGELVSMGDSLVLSIHIVSGDFSPDVTSLDVVGQSNDIKWLVHRAAEQTLQKLEPYAFACYLASSKRHHEAESVALRECLPDCEESMKQWVFALLGDVNAARKNWNEATRYYKMALRDDGTFAPALSNWAVMLWDKGDRDLADSTFQLAIRHGKGKDVFQFNYSCFLSNVGRLKESLIHVDSAIMIDSTDAFSWDQRGLIMSLLGKHDSATIAYEKAAELAPAIAGFKIGLAKEYLAGGDTARACAEWEKAGFIDSVHAEMAWYNLGVIQNRQGEFAKAVSNLQLATKSSTPTGIGYRDYYVQYGVDSSMDWRLIEYWELAIAADSNHDTLQSSSAYNWIVANRPNSDTARLAANALSRFKH